MAVIALLATLALVFAFHADSISGRFLHVVLIGIPILIQAFRIPHNVASTEAPIGASSIYELAAATAIALRGPESGAAFAAAGGVVGGGAGDALFLFLR